MVVVRTDGAVRGSNLWPARCTVISHQPNAGPMLCQHQRRRHSIEPAPGECFTLGGLGNIPEKTVCRSEAEWDSRLGCSYRWAAGTRIHAGWSTAIRQREPQSLRVLTPPRLMILMIFWSFSQWQQIVHGLCYTRQNNSQARARWLIRILDMLILFLYWPIYSDCCKQWWIT